MAKVATRSANFTPYITAFVYRIWNTVDWHLVPVHRRTTPHRSSFPMAELDNANPTIISISDLPSHRQRRTLKSDDTTTHSIRELLLAKPQYSLDPYYMSDSEDTDSDDTAGDPIDEQEIYGEYSCLYSIRTAHFVSISVRSCQLNIFDFHALSVLNEIDIGN